jgi:hypothetical protein
MACVSSLEFTRKINIREGETEDVVDTTTTELYLPQMSDQLKHQAALFPFKGLHLAIQDRVTKENINRKITFFIRPSLV